jgi:signal transduction histidine kinase
VRRRQAVLALVGSALLILGLLTVFAIELSNTQAKSKRDVEARVHERAVLAGALIDSLFQTTQSSVPTYTKLYGGDVTAATMNRARRTNTYIAVLDSAGNVIASSDGFTAQARADLAQSAALRLVRAGHVYGLGNVLPYGKTGVVNFAVKFPARDGSSRILLSGFAPKALGTFVTADLLKIPGVKGAHNYLIDGNDTVVASTNPQRPVGYRFTQPEQVAALAKSSGDRLGHYYDQVPLANSTMRIVLTAPNGPLFSTVSGFRKWVPWLIFIAFALFAIAALVLGERALRSADKVHEANERLEARGAELAEANAALEQRAQELVRSNAELEQFASIASHDLQEPLRKVRTFTDQLKVTESDRLSEKGVDYLRRANAAAERMQTLIQDLLKFSRVATHGRPFVPVDLGDVTGEVLEDLEAQIQRTGGVVEVGQLPTISADPLQMRQLLQNLISNALKFHRDGVPPEVAVSAKVEDGRAELTVRDNGIGFEPQYAGRIFRVFERLHGRSEYPGTGIGLALCRKIAERHGGTAFADATPGVGATFTVILPVHQPDDELADWPAGEAPQREESYVTA